MSKCWLKVLVLCLIILLSSGCRRGPESRPQAPKNQEKVKVAMISATTFSDDYKVFKMTVEENGKKEGLELLWLDGAGNPLKQIELLEKAGQEKVKVVIIEPVDPEIIRDSISKLQKEGIKLITINSLPPDTAIEGFISPDFERAGEIQAQQFINSLPPDSEPVDVLILRANKGEAVADALVRGNLQVLQSNRKTGQIIIEEIVNQDAAKAYARVKEYLTGTKKPGAVLAHTPTLTESMLRAVNEFSTDQGKPLTFGVGTQKMAVETIGKGQHFGEVEFMPELLAQIVVRAAKELSGNNPWEYELMVENGSHDVPARFTPIRSIVKENIGLLADRMKVLEKAEGQGIGEESKGSSKKAGGSEDNSSSGEQQGQAGKEGEEGKPKKNTLIIKTKEGQEFKMDIMGEIESIEMKGAAEEEKEKQE